jgi:hypothetical protein
MAEFEKIIDLKDGVELERLGLGVLAAGSTSGVNLANFPSTCGHSQHVDHGTLQLGTKDPP